MNVIVSVEVVIRSCTFVSVPVAKVNVGPSSPLIVVVAPPASVPQTMFPCESVSRVLQETRDARERFVPEAFVKFTCPTNVELPETKRLVIVEVVSVD